MRLLSGIIEIGVLALFAILFVGYALFIYPVEKISQKIDPEVKQKRLKYAPQL